MKKQFLILFAFISVLALSQVPQRFNKVIVTGDIVSPKFIRTGSTVDSVLLGNGSARSVNSIKTDTVSLSNRINAKAAGTGTANGTNTGDETLTSIKTKLGAATSVSDGYLKYQDFVKFDGKLSSEVDGSTTNELQTISTNGAAGNITLSNSGGTLNLNVNDADASTTNEIQDLSLSGNTLSLSSDATTVDISQATAVLANTAKVSNATHTGDVSGSTALTLATVNSNVGTFNNITINAKGLATAGSNVSYQAPLTIGNLTSTTSGVTIGNGTGAVIGSGATVNIATAGVTSDGILTSGHFNTFNNKEPAITKNTAFNKNFGTTTGTVLEGRTFGTAANSAVGDFILNNNSSAQSANMWVSGNGYFGGEILANTIGNYVNPLTLNSTGSLPMYLQTNGNTVLTLATSGAATFASTVNATQLQSTVATGTAPLTVNSTTMVGNLNAQYLGGLSRDEFLSTSGKYTNNANANDLVLGYGLNTTGNGVGNSNFASTYGIVLSFPNYFNAQFDLSSVNILSHRIFDGTTWTGWKTFNSISTQSTLNLTTNYLPKWNGSSFVNSLISDDGTSINISGSLTSTSFIKSGGTSSQFLKANGSVDATNYQPAITLTTTGTSGAATFSGGVLNVPNYNSIAVGDSYTCIERNNYGVTIGLAKAYFTKVGNITSIAINADCTTTATGWCSIQLPTPSVSSPNWSATCNAFITGASPAVLQACLQVESPNYVTIAFYSTAAGVPVKITVTGMAK